MSALSPARGSRVLPPLLARRVAFGGGVQQLGWSVVFAVCASLVARAVLARAGVAMPDAGVSAAGVVGLLSIGLGVLVVGRILDARRLALLRDGTLVEARSLGAERGARPRFRAWATGTTVGIGATGPIRGVELAFEADGAVHRTRSYALPPDAYPRGQLTYVAYDPRDPRRHLLVRTLPGAPSVEGGALTEVARAWPALVLPVLTAVALVALVPCALAA